MASRGGAGAQTEGMTAFHPPAGVHIAKQSPKAAIPLSPQLRTSLQVDSLCQWMTF